LFPKIDSFICWYMIHVYIFGRVFKYYVHKIGGGIRWEKTAKFL